MSYSIDKLKPHMLYKNKNFVFSNFTKKKQFLQKMVGPPVSTVLPVE